MLEVMKTLTPTHVVFNGVVGALTGDKALTADVGDKVLFLHSQANRDSRPHLIGGHGDLVWTRGSFGDKPATNLETWFVPGGSAVAMLYEFKQPGLYVYLSHNLIEAIMLGAAAHVNVEGDWDDNPNRFGRRQSVWTPVSPQLFPFILPLVFRSAMSSRACCQVLVAFGQLAFSNQVNPDRLSVKVPSPLSV